MININSFGIIGGDKRQLAAARSLASDGYTVYLSGFDRLEQLLGTFGGSESVEETAIFSEVIILPLPVTKDGKNLNAPFSDKKIPLDDSFALLMKGKRVFCAMKDRLLKTSKLWNSEMVYDYLDREELKVCNAVPTALMKGGLKR